VAALAVLAGCAGPAGRSVAPPPVLGAEQEGLASWYGGEHHGRRTASGEPFDMRALTAAHPTLPFGTRLRVTSLASGRAVEVRVNDRGPFVDGRVLDLSQEAARRLGALGAGIVRVRLRIVGLPDGTREPP
jgi:rare lipoprotein A